MPGAAPARTADVQGAVPAAYLRVRLRRPVPLEISPSSASSKRRTRSGMTSATRSPSSASGNVRPRSRQASSKCRSWRTRTFATRCPISRIRYRAAVRRSGPSGRCPCLQPAVERGVRSRVCVVDMSLIERSSVCLLLCEAVSELLAWGGVFGWRRAISCLTLSGVGGAMLVWRVALLGRGARWGGRGGTGCVPRRARSAGGDHSPPARVGAQTSVPLAALDS